MPGDLDKYFVSDCKLHREVSAADVVGTQAAVAALPVIDCHNIRWAFRNVLHLFIQAPAAAGYKVTVYATPVGPVGSNLGSAVIDEFAGNVGCRWVSVRDFPPGNYRVAITSVTGLGAGEKISVYFMRTE